MSSCCIISPWAKRESGITECFQVSEDIRKDMLKENNELVQLLKEKLEDSSIDGKTKSHIRRILGDTDDSRRMEEEAIRYSLWLDSERASSFFADIVLICEGATEKTFIDYLLKNEWSYLREKKICVLDVMGKYNIHRYMNLFQALGIYHSVLVDRDEDNNVHEIINQFIKKNKNEYTKKIHFFNKNIEDFLGIPMPPPNRKDKRPLNVMWHYKNSKIEETKINQLKEIIEGLL